MERIQEFVDRFTECDKWRKLSQQPEKVIAWLRANRLLSQPTDIRCEGCGQAGGLSDIRDAAKVDGLRLRCRYCKRPQSIRAGSIFDGIKMPLIVIFRVIFIYFLEGKTITQCSEEIGIHKNTVSKYYSYTRKVISIHRQEFYKNYKLGEQNYWYEKEDGTMDQAKAVEVDESLCTHTPGIGSLHSRQVWLLGIYDRATEELRVFVVGRERTSEKLIPYIENHVAAPGPYPTIIYTDDWRAYDALNQIPYYEHRSILHTRGFGRGSETTNHIESCWSQLYALSDLKAGMNTENLDIIQEFVDVGLWRRDNQRFNLVELLAELLSQAAIPMTE